MLPVALKKLVAGSYGSALAASTPVGTVKPPAKDLAIGEQRVRDFAMFFISERSYARVSRVGQMLPCTRRPSCPNRPDAKFTDPVSARGPASLAGAARRMLEAPR